jgi:hypothetical protein
VKKSIVLLLVIVFALPGIVSASSYEDFLDEFGEYEGITSIPANEIKRMYGKLHEQEEFIRSINRMKERQLKVDVKDFYGFSSEKYTEKISNEVQHDVNVYVFTYGNKKENTEGRIVIVCKFDSTDIQIISNVSTSWTN